MKSHIRFVFRMLLMVLALQFVPVEGYMPVAQAATTAQQKAKAKAKKQKEKEKAKASKKKNSLVSKVTNSAVNTVGREFGRAIARGILGIFKK